MSEIRKLTWYDDFKCTGGQCNFTCCAGWDISVDLETYDRWKQAGHAGFFDQYVQETGRRKYTMRLDPEKRCPFLNEEGLCNIVIAYGDEQLPVTCRTFPRLTNCFDGISEYSLSFACPAMVDLLHQRDDGLDLQIAHSDSSQSIGYLLREAMLTIVSDSTYTMRDRVLLSFQLLADTRDEITAENLSEKESIISLLHENISKFMDPYYRNSLIEFWSGIEVKPTDSWLEMNELFLDITQNYSEERQYRKLFRDIYRFAEILDTEEDTSALELFDKVFLQHQQLLEKVFAAKLFACCVSDDLNELILSFQLLVTEYIMIRYGVFLRWLMKNKDVGENRVDYETVRDYIVCFSRILGYNSEGMKEFWEESFDEAIWELGYLMLLVS